MAAPGLIRYLTLGTKCQLPGTSQVPVTWHQASNTSQPSRMPPPNNENTMCYHSFFNKNYKHVSYFEVFEGWLRLPVAVTAAVVSGLRLPD